MAKGKGGAPAPSKKGDNPNRASGKAHKKSPKPANGPALTGRGKATGRTVDGYSPAALERRALARTSAAIAKKHAAKKD